MPFLPPEFRIENLQSRLSWNARVLENLKTAFAMPIRSVAPSGAGTAPFALVRTGVHYGRAQTVSAATHVAILFALVFLFAVQRNSVPIWKPTPIGPRPSLSPYLPREGRTGTPSLGISGVGGGNERKPATVGQLAPPSSMPLTRPRLTHEEQHDLPVPPAVFDANASSVVPVVTDLGLPWMDKDTNSAGLGKGRGIGNKAGNGMGDDEGTGAGFSNDSGPYADVVSQAACLYCPEPPYTDDARKAKLQGTVTVRVLIGVDGKARRIQVVKGLGLGLDETAIAAIRGWRFAPARDARKQPIASWATIETRFQLF
jgi:protein TonB